MAIKSVSIRIDEELLNELHRVADYEGRSANSQMLILVRDCVENTSARGRSIPLTTPDGGYGYGNQELNRPDR